MQSEVSIKCIDGYVLGGTLFEPRTKANLVIQLNTATATRQHFYFHFAKYLCSELNAVVLVFDYRGIGNSKPKTGLKGFDVAYEDWGQLDLTSVTYYLKQKYPTLPLVYVAHSVGGQMVGLLPCLDLVEGLVTVGSTAGYVKNMRKSYRLKSWFFFEVLRPITIAIYGYGKFKALGVMEDLPKRLVNTWRNWCNVSDYFFDPKYSTTVKGIEGYKNLNIPIYVLIAEDDEIATKLNVQNFWKHTVNKKETTIEYISPKDHGLDSIGHFGFFKKEMKRSLWPLALQKIKTLIPHE